jgi:hypothetical protein
MPLYDIREVVTLGAGVFSLIMLLASIRKMGQEMYVPVSAPFVAIAVTALAVGIYIALTGAQVNWQAAALVMGAGFFIGLLEGQLTRLYYRGPIIFGRRSAGYLALWGLAYLLTLALSQIGSETLQAAGVMVLVFGLGMAMGDNINLLVRQAVLKSPNPARQPAPPGQTAPPAAGPATRRSGGCALAIGCLIGLACLAAILIVAVMAMFWPA